MEPGGDLDVRHRHGRRLLGVAIGIWMYSPSKRYRYAGAPTSIPYRGQKRWHTLFGLIFGVGAVTWAFSGMLSMDPFPSSDGEQQRRPAARRPRRAARRSAPNLRATHPRRRWQLGAAVKKLEFTSFAGQPIYLPPWPAATRASSRLAGPRAGFDQEQIVRSSQPRPTDAADAGAGPV